MLGFSTPKSPPPSPGTPTPRLPEHSSAWDLHWTGACLPVTPKDTASPTVTVVTRHARTCAQTQKAL